MAELTKQEELERLKKSLDIAEDRLSVIERRLPELGDELERLLVIDEIKGYKNQTIKRTQTEIEDLGKEKSLLELKISALKKSLPKIEKQAKIEIASTDTVKDYQKAHNEIRELLNSVPSLDALKSEIEKIEQCSKALEDAKSNYFFVSRKLADVMGAEKLDSVGDVTLDVLRTDRNELDYGQVLHLSDALIDLNSELNLIQYRLFTIGTASISIKEPSKSVVAPEYSDDGQYCRVKEGISWVLYKEERRLQEGSFGVEDYWVIVKESIDKPEFPQKPEFSPCGKFRVEKENSKWSLFQKQEGGRWVKIRFYWDLCGYISSFPQWNNIAIL